MSIIYRYNIYLLNNDRIFLMRAKIIGKIRSEIKICAKIFGAGSAYIVHDPRYSFLVMRRKPSCFMGS